jgi:hypothetical protein
VKPKLLLIIALLWVPWSGCSFNQLPQESQMADLDGFEAYEPAAGMERVMIGAPHGTAEPIAVEYAKWLSRRTGAGLVVALRIRAQSGSRVAAAGGFHVHDSPSEDPLRRGSIYKEFKQLLEQTGGGKVKLYIGIRLAEAGDDVDGIETATSGLSLEELRLLKELYERIRDRELQDASVPKIPIALEPLDRITWQVSGIKHHGVLMSAERGVNIRLPQMMTSERIRAAYKRVLASWISAAVIPAGNSLSAVPHIQVQVMEHGRIEFMAATQQRKGIVIAAPHGSFDAHTAELVRRLSYRTGAAAVIATGFTPTETPGWRINVNRPSERLYPGGELEIRSLRASRVYDAFREAVFAASRGPLQLYVDIHQNGRERDIEVATVGISSEEARAIKKSFRDIRDGVLQGVAPPRSVDLRIEPLDSVEIGAWAAKARGILGLAARSLHFELPLNDVLRNDEARDAYTRVLVELLTWTVQFLHGRPVVPPLALTSGAALQYTTLGPAK